MDWRTPSYLTRLLTFLLTTVAALPYASAQQNVGKVGAVNPASTGTPPGAASRTLVIGTEVLHKERIQTSSVGSTQVVFPDTSTLNVGRDSNIVIDEYVYNPNAGTGSMVASLGKGVMRFVGGQISHTQGMQVKTPVATLGVRGGVVTVVYPLPASIASLDAEHRRLQRPAGDRPCRRDHARQQRQLGAGAAGLCGLREFGEPADRRTVPGSRRGAATGHGAADELAWADRRRCQSSDRSDDGARGPRRHDPQRSDAASGKRSTQPHRDPAGRRLARPQPVADQPDAEHRRSAATATAAASGAAGRRYAAAADIAASTTATATSTAATTASATAATTTAALWRRRGDLSV